MPTKSESTDSPRWPWLLGGAVLGLAALTLYFRREVMEGASYAFRSAYSGNFGGLRTHSVDQIVIHTTESSKEEAENWFAMPHGTVGPTSAHYVVGVDGSITQMVPEESIAWHAGEATVNGRSIGIECEGRAADASTWTPALVNALVELCSRLVARYKIPILHSKWTAPGIFGHSDIPAAAAEGKVDPGVFFPWDIVIYQIQSRTRGMV